MRILVVVPFYKPAYGFGGPTRSVPTLAEALTRRGHEVHVATTDASTEGTLDVPTGSPQVVDGVRVTYFRQKRIAGRMYFSPGLSRFLRSNASKYEIAYVYGIWPHPPLAAGAACRNAGTPYIVSPRTGLMEWPLRRRRVLKELHLLLFGRRYLNGAAAIHYTTEKEKRESERLRFESDGFVVPNPVDISEFEDYRENIRRDSFAETDTQASESAGPQKSERIEELMTHGGPTALFLGRLEPRKGLELALRAFAAVRDEVRDARFVVAGPSYRGHRRELAKVVEELGIGDAVHFTGYLDSTERLISLDEADVFVLTSWTENFAVAAVEAMAMECPPVLTEEVGVAPDAGEAGAALVVERSVEAVRRALSELFERRDRRDDVGRRARQHVRVFEPGRVAASIEREFERVLD